MAESMEPAIESIVRAEALASAPEEPVTPVAQAAALAEDSSNTEIQNTQSIPEKADSQYEKDLDVLARLITAEAQGEPYDAKVAVGAVVMNRVESGLWAATIKDVIYQNINGYYQFTPVANGWINKPAESESIKAAQAALSGVDPTSGAQFYYDDKATNTWILSKPISVQIGHMTYAYN
ncbi:cell wall hydrolase [Clostridium aminobutyricum]|uniref:Cell wall hydrolase n=2 Tax=Clostridium aminobutyricum TaxID=33953 RepID=A0A939D6K6_CLOAM|nr:cell wall hydrolase [Clostridium aminobutyricum]